GRNLCDSIVPASPIFVPDSFMVLDRVFMERAESKPPVCDLKNLISPHAIVLSAPLPRFAADCEDRGTVVPELQ
ncbi:hypothetical protein M9458_012023, partial [Cirrhinus mrigala]